MHDLSPTIPSTNDLDRPAAMLAVYDGQRCIGHVVNRGKTGAEAFDVNEKSIGLFKNTTDEATACWKHAHHQPISAETIR